MSWRDGSSSASILDAPAMLRVALEQELERAEAAQDVLRGIGAIDAHDQALRPVLPKRGLPLENRIVGRQRVQLRPDRRRSAAPTALDALAGRRDGRAASANSLRQRSV